MVKKSLCVLSGGLDSTTATAMSINDGYDIIALHFSYNQLTQQRESEAFDNIVEYLKIENVYKIDLGFFNLIGSTALIDKSIKVPTGGLTDGVPATYVPFRNGIFLSIAAAIAEKEGASKIVLGAVEEDSSGYPDCRSNFISSMQQSINLGTKDSTKITLHTPLIDLNKAQIVQQALQIDAPLHLTWSCYQNSSTACGVCDSCRLRLRGFEIAGVKDLIPYSK